MREQKRKYDVLLNFEEFKNMMRDSTNLHETARCVIVCLAIVACVFLMSSCHETSERYNYERTKLDLEHYKGVAK